MDQRQAMAGLFDRAAATYDQVGVELFGPAADLLVGELSPQPGERVLDLGCGRGAVLLRAARRAGPVTGLDLSPQMVAAARAEAVVAGVEVEVVVGDAAAPPLPAGSYDVVASSLVVFFLPDPPAALHAWTELLADRGRLGITTFGPTTEAWQPVDAELMQHLPAGGRDPRTTGRAGPFASDAGVEGLLSAAGLQEVRTAISIVPVRFDDVEHWHRWSWSVAQRAAWEAVPEPDRPALRTRLQGLVEQARLPDGRLGFDQVVRCTVGRRR